MPTAAVKLPAILEKFVASQVREGTYRSREAAIVAAVQHQKRRSEQLAWLQSEIQKGLDSGPADELDIENVIRRGSRRVAARAQDTEGVHAVKHPAAQSHRLKHQHAGVATCGEFGCDLG